MGEEWQRAVGHERVQGTKDMRENDISIGRDKHDPLGKLLLRVGLLLICSKKSSTPLVVIPLQISTFFGFEPS